MNPFKKTTNKRVRARLLYKRNLTLREFAAKHGFNEQTVKVCLHRYCGKIKTAREGSVAANILFTLNQELA